MQVRGDRLRHAVRAVHLWLGLGIGGLLVMLGLTGSVLVFYPELDALLHPQIREQASAQTKPDWDRALATVRQAYPDKQGPWRFELTGEAGAIPARYYTPPERAGHDFRPMMVWLSPDGSRVLRRDYWGEYAMTFLYDLHYRLLLGETGGALLGWLGFVLLALLLSGLWAWWPKGSWIKAFRLKLRAHPQRSLRDWHKLAGLSGLLFLVILTVTGIMLALPEESDSALAATGLPGSKPRPRKAVSSGCACRFPAIPASAFRTAMSGSTAPAAKSWRSRTRGRRSPGAWSTTGCIRCTKARLAVWRDGCW